MVDALGSKQAGSSTTTVRRSKGWAMMDRTRWYAEWQMSHKGDLLRMLNLLVLLTPSSAVNGTFLPLHPSRTGSVPPLLQC